ncbi:unnamed protein product [Phaedon cochleariae]|uniref:Lysosome-associated membrane glycoprotein 5 n=1 Tax=Phaedon cochleariae TaxID=80249 RepID=A0A9N9X4V4_PHACE|nr:unnamed protein product [Phaedon cochleariae]
MEKLKLSLVLFAIFASSYGKNDINFVPPQPHPNSSTKPPITTTHAPNTTTHAPNTTTHAPNTTTLAPNTTTIAPNTTTAAPNTTTMAPNTTTLAPNTTTAAPITTTMAPNTTTVAPITTPSPAPKPVPDPSMGNWSVNYENTNHSCLGVDMAGQLEFLEANHTMKLNLPPNATANGMCSNESDSLVLHWGNNNMKMDFRRMNTSKYELGLIKVVLVNLTLPGQAPKNYTLVHNTTEFSTPLSNSYKCAKVQTLNLTEENKNDTIAYLHVSHVQFQAFRNATGHTFDSAIDCDGSVTNDVVPIVVGCVLAALVVMVLVAYLIGRRRCQARGYLSMFADTKSESDYIPMKNISCFK